MKPPEKTSGAARKTRKPITLGLQGGGAHGAFTWGVLDRLLEDDRLDIVSISGTSAGAMNAVIAVSGFVENGPAGARERLAGFWKAVSAQGDIFGFRRSPVAAMMNQWSLNYTPAYLAFDMFTQFAGPKDFNPLNINPLRLLVDRTVDFEAIHRCSEIDLYIAATNVESGQVRIFSNAEISLDATMASSCLPTLFHPVKIDGASYWDGGYMGNPPLSPLVEKGRSSDIVIVQVNPTVRPGVPRAARDIMNRMNELSGNSALMHELRTLDLVARLMESGKLSEDDYPRMFIHRVNVCEDTSKLDASSKMNTEWDFLIFLRDLGRGCAESWLAENFDALGERSSLDLRAMFGDTLARSLPANGKENPV